MSRPARRRKNLTHGESRGISLRTDDHGQNIVEYALIVALVVLAIVGSVYALWRGINRLGD